MKNIGKWKFPLLLLGWGLAVIAAKYTMEYMGFEEKPVYLVLEILSIVFGSVLSYIAIDYLVEAKFKGRSGTSSTKTTIRLISKILIFVVASAMIIDAIGYFSKINNTAIFGLFGITLGLTASIWFPDIFAGLTMIFTKYISEEDVIEIKDENLFGVIHRIGLFFTIVRNLQNDHFVVMRNSKVRDASIDALSRVTSPQGLKKKLEFKIGYKREKEPLKVKEVYAFFEKAFENAKKAGIQGINFDKGIECYLKNPGDHALEFLVFYYIQKDKVKLAKKIEWRLYEAFYETSVEKGFDLSTPITIEHIN